MLSSQSRHEDPCRPLNKGGLKSRLYLIRAAGRG